jgi:oxygen-independent coproporphyrinogen III oxidase
MAIMCQGRTAVRVHRDGLADRFQSLLCPELHPVEVMQAQGLVQVSESKPGGHRVGWYFVRAVAMVFDRYLQADRNRSRFSKII